MSPLLEVRDLSVSFTVEGGEVQAVRHVSFPIERGESIALVGESGSGKSVTALSVMQLLPYPTARHPSGSILFQGQELVGAPERAMQRVRGDRIAMIFQEPMTSLNPLHTIDKQVNEVLRVYHTDQPSLTRSGGLVVNPLVGRLEHMTNLNENLDYLVAAPIELCRSGVHYTRFSFHAGVGVWRQFSDVRTLGGKLVSAMALPIGWAVFIRDMRRAAQTPSLQPVR